jgi:RNA recognition motif-containing protein
MNIYVGNVSAQVSDADLNTLFAEFGEVSSARVMVDRFSNESRGFGFVDIADKASAINAINGLNGKEFKGKELIVNEARPKKDSRDGNRRDGNRW